MDAPDFGQGVLAQMHDVAGSPVVAGSPGLPSPAVSQTQIGSASDVTSAAPVMGSPAIAQKHDLAAVTSVSGTPALSEPNLEQTHGIIAAKASQPFRLWVRRS